MMLTSCDLRAVRSKVGQLIHLRSDTMECLILLGFEPKQIDSGSNWLKLQQHLFQNISDMQVKVKLM